MTEGKLIVTIRSVDFPQVKSWRELFEGGVRPYALMQGDTSESYGVFPHPYHANPGDAAPVLTDFVAVDGASLPRIYLHARLNAEIQAHLARTMISIENDTYAVRVSRWPDGRALVYVQYGRIIGDHWLALIDSDTIPNQVEEG